MSMPSRADTQAIGRPLIQQALDEQGVSVKVIRAGGEVELVALFVPVTPDGKRVTRVGDPEYAQQTAKFFFRHDAEAVRMPGFNLLKGGQIYIPTSPAVDIADQGVALMLVAQPLVERTRVESLTFTIPGVGTVRDAKGNLVPAPGVPLTVPARLSATDDPRVRDMVGADSASAVLIGRWGTLSHPLLRPNGVRWGSASPLTLDGQAGTLTVKLAYPDADLAQEAQFGGRFVATWKAGS